MRRGELTYDPVNPGSGGSITTSHGTLSAIPGIWALLYTPAPGFRGLDSFTYKWTYTEHDQNGNSYDVTTNPGNYAIQVGNWVDLLPQNTYQNDPHKSIMGIGEKETTTLTLDNPRPDGVPSTGYWSLSFDRNLIRCYTADGQEILPDAGPFGNSGDNTLASKFIETIPGCSSKAVTLTVVGVGAGTTDVEAHWSTWACHNDGSQPGQPGWVWGTLQDVNYSVLALMWDGQDVTNKHHVAVKAGQKIELSVVELPDPDSANYSWSLDGCGLLGDYVKDFDPSQNYNNQQVTYLTPEDFHQAVLSFVWVAGGSDRNAEVTVAGQTLDTWFDVSRPANVLLTTQNYQSDDQGMNGVNVGTYRTPDGLYESSAFCWPGVNGTGVIEGITFDTWPPSVPGFQTCFCQVVDSPFFNGTMMEPPV